MTILTSLPTGKRSQTILQYSMADSTLHVQIDLEIGERGMNPGLLAFVKSNSIRLSQFAPKAGVWSNTKTVL